MIQVKHKDGEFLVKGTYFLGIAGTYENKDFAGEQLFIDYTLEDIEEDLEQGRTRTLGPLYPILEQAPKDGEAVAKILETYYNEQEEKIKANIRQINSCLWIYLFENLLACGYPYWEIEEAVLPEMRAKYEEDAMDALYGDEEICDTINRLFDEYYDSPNDGSIEKTEVEPKLRKLFPMFNFDGLVQSMEPEGVTFHGRYMSFQFSDGWGAQLYCAAYDEYDEHFTSKDWHNH